MKHVIEVNTNKNIKYIEKPKNKFGCNFDV